MYAVVGEVDRKRRMLRAGEWVLRRRWIKGGVSTLYENGIELRRTRRKMGYVPPFFSSYPRRQSRDDPVRPIALQRLRA